jgi:hypothetical protein
MFSSSHLICVIVVVASLYHENSSQEPHFYVAYLCSWKENGFWGNSKKEYHENSNQKPYFQLLRYMGLETKLRGKCTERRRRSK